MKLFTLSNFSLSFIQNISTVQKVNRQIRSTNKNYLKNNKIYFLFVILIYYLNKFINYFLINLLLL